MMGVGTWDVRAQLEGLREFGAIPADTDVAELAAALEALDAEQHPDVVTHEQIVEGMGQVMRILVAHGFRLPKELVLFFKLYDIKPDGTIVLAHRLIAPIRIADFTHRVHAQLPGIVHRFAKGDRIALTVAASDAAYKGNNASGPVTISTSPGFPGVLKLPVVSPRAQKPVRVQPLTGR